MNTFVLEKWDDKGKRCTFYSVRWDNNDISETDKFFEKYDQIEKYCEANKALLALVLDEIGDIHGAKDVFFNRYENEVSGLPPHGKLIHLNIHLPNFPLRLYALKIREDIVILFNGGIKDGRTNQTSSLNFNWQEACQFSRKIEQAIREGDIIINENKRLLLTYANSEEIIL